MRLITLPGQEEMARRLDTVDVDDVSHIKHRLYPLILENAGRSLSGEGVVNVLAIAIGTYTNDFLQEVRGEIRTYLMGLIEQFVRALIDDEQVLEEAIAHAQTQNRPTR